MQKQTSSKAKDFFINLGTIVGLYTVVGALISLLFTVINTAYPQIANGYITGQSISRSVATIIVFTPIFILLMWLLEKDFAKYPDKRNEGIHKRLTYLTLFISGIIIAGDLITVLYYFLDGQELTIGFILKVIALLIIAGTIFAYYLTDTLNKSSKKGRLIYMISACTVILASIVRGFSVLGSPATQRLYRYDDQKVNDLMSINNEINNYYATNGTLPDTLSGAIEQYYYSNILDPQTQEAYIYEKTTKTTYNLCTQFNKESSTQYTYYDASWSHPAGQHCFKQTINENIYSKPAIR